MMPRLSPTLGFTFWDKVPDGPFMDGCVWSAPNFIFMPPIIWIESPDPTVLHGPLMWFDYRNVWGATENQESRVDIG